MASHIRRTTVRRRPKLVCPFRRCRLEPWVASRDTLQRLQIVGKIRLSTAPARNHWWHIAYHMSSRGITSRPMGTGPIFSVDFDFVDHRLVVSTDAGAMKSFPLTGQSVASFYQNTVKVLESLGIRVVEHPASLDSVNREAYSREVISSGFWFGDSTFEEPAFYSYTPPEPVGLASDPLFPPTAEWLDRGASHLAVYRRRRPGHRRPEVIGLDVFRKRLSGGRYSSRLGHRSTLLTSRIDGEAARSVGGPF